MLLEDNVICPCNAGIYTFTLVDQRDILGDEQCKKYKCKYTYVNYSIDMYQGNKSAMTGTRHIRFKG